MLGPTIVMGIIAIVLFVIAIMQKNNSEWLALKSGASMFIEIVPLLILAFIVAGLVKVLLPTDLVSQWIGKESGLKGIIIGAIAGGIMPGGPFVSMPIAAGLLKAGASPGTMVAFLTGWSLLAVNRLPLEIGILGWRFTMLRLASTFLLAPLAGLLANFIFYLKK